MINTMILVKGGQFLMGDVSMRFSKESRPIHQTKVNSFYINKYPVTQEFWLSIIGKNPSNIKNPMSPVEMVSWIDAINFCNTLSLLSYLRPCYEINGEVVTCHFNRDGYRLPTEAEWEYAAKGGNKKSTYMYAGSDNIDDVAWYTYNAKGKSHNVGSKKPNDLGLCDISGNVWEWCWDWYGNYSAGISENPIGPQSGITKIYRGGSYIDFDYGCTVFIRGKRKPTLKQIDIGFRLARSLV